MNDPSVLAAGIGAAGMLAAAVVTQVGARRRTARTAEPDRAQQALRDAADEALPGRYARGLQQQTEQLWSQLGAVREELGRVRAQNEALEAKSDQREIAYRVRIHDQEQRIIMLEQERDDLRRERDRMLGMGPPSPRRIVHEEPEADA